MKHCGLLLLFLATCFVTFSTILAIAANDTDAEEFILKPSSKHENTNDSAQHLHQADLNTEEKFSETKNSQNEETTQMPKEPETFSEDEETSGNYDEILHMDTVELLLSDTEENLGQLNASEAENHDGYNITGVSETETPLHESAEDVKETTNNSTKTEQTKAETIPEPLPLFSNQEHRETKGVINHQEKDSNKWNFGWNDTVDDDDNQLPKTDFTQTLGVETEGLFPVIEDELVQVYENETEPPYSGDGEFENKSKDDPESHASGEEEYITSPLIQQLETVPTQLPTRQASQPDNWEHPAKRPLKAPVTSRLRCEDISCEKRHSLRVTSSSMGGAVIPSDTELTIRCVAYSFINDTAVITWHLPTRAVVSPNHTVADDESEVIRRINVTESITDLPAKKERLIISTLRVVNITDDDAGTYTCLTILIEQCCHSNVTVNIRVYNPPSYALDFAIVGAVCFVEFLIILYFKTRSHKKKTKANPRSNGFSGDYKSVPTNPTKDQKFEEEVQQQLLT